MKNRKVLFLTSLLAVTCLASCRSRTSSSSNPGGSSELPNSSSEQASSSDSGNSSSNPGPTSIVLPEPNLSEVFDNTPGYLPNEIILNHKNASVLVNEEFQLKPVAQYKYSGSNLRYSSKDATVASVNAETGLVKGLKAGKTEIEVYDKDNPSFKTSIPVTVNKQLDEDEIASLCGQLGAIDESGLKKLYDHELYEKTVYKQESNPDGSLKVDGQGKPVFALQNYMRKDQKIAVSEPDGYYRCLETDADINTKNGAVDFTDEDLVLYNNSSYVTYAYHESPTAKNYLRIPYQSYMDEPRISPIIVILKHLYVDGQGYYDGLFKSAKLASFAGDMTQEYTNVIDKFAGSNGAGQGLFGFTITFDNDVAEEDDESRYGIPVGTPMPATQTMRYIVENNKVISYSAILNVDYEIDGVKYHEYYNIDHSYREFTDDDFYKPNPKDYTLVDDLFDLY